MAGEAKTNAFNLATATVMIGPQTDLLKLNVAEHSIGLVKNFQIQADPSYVELTQGVKNTIVYSVLNNNPVKCTMEVYEYTSKNLAYGLGLDGSGLAAITTTHVTDTDVVGDDTVKAFTISGPDASADFVAGDWMVVQEVGGTDEVFVSKVVSAAFATNVTTVTVRDAVPTGMTLHAGALISKVNRVDIGSKADQPFLAAKISVVLPQDNEPLIVLIPKLRITKGFTAAFHTDQFGNLPYEFTPYELVNSDPNFADFGGKGVAAIFDRF